MKINISAAINNTGYGVASFNIIKELSYKHDISLFPLGGASVSTQEDYDLIKKIIDNSAMFDIDAPYVKIWHQFDLSSHIGRGRYFAFPFFELDTFNNLEKNHLSIPDTIIVSSKWAEQVILNNIKATTKIVPLGVDRNIFNPDNQMKLHFKNPDKYIFLNIGKWEIRKGHDILLELFNSAFPSEQDVELWILASENTNSYSTKEQLEEWKRKYKDKRVRLFDGADSHNDIAHLISNCDCGIYPSRAEGWNLELLETMSMNKPVIATNYSAHTEFCNNQNCFLIDISETEKAFDGKAFQGQGNWAKIGEKEKDQIISHMRHVYKNRINTNPNGVITAKKYSWENSAEALIRCIS